jgi:carboxylate-amine ligase
LAQTLVTWCNQRIDAGDLPDPPREWTVRENRWFASRYGMEADLIVETEGDDKPMRRPIRELVMDLTELLAETAAELGTENELADILDIAADGTGTTRQRRLVEEGGTLLDVVHLLADELANEQSSDA